MILPADFPTLAVDLFEQHFKIEPVTRQFFILIPFLLCVHCYAQLNNPIFLGGQGDGSESVCYKQNASNMIFEGGIGDGNISVCFVQTSTNAIFAGGIGNGNISICYEQFVTNLIFAGGIGDGNMSICYEQFATNLIFAGGIGDGNMSICYEEFSLNAIFAGNIGDGYQAACFQQSETNMIYAGGIGDGYESSKVGQFPQTIVWQGEYSNDWQFPLNWFPIRIPTIEDNIIIQTINYNPTLSNRVLGIGEQSADVTEFGRNVYILQGSTIQMINESKIRLNNQMDVYGMLFSKQSGNETILAMPLSQLNIFPKGKVLITK